VPVRLSVKVTGILWKNALLCEQKHELTGNRRFVNSSLSRYFWLAPNFSFPSLKLEGCSTKCGDLPGVNISRKMGIM